jgi:hypothetical protein
MAAHAAAEDSTDRKAAPKSTGRRYATGTLIDRGFARLGDLTALEYGQDDNAKQA